MYYRFTLFTVAKSDVFKYDIRPSKTISDRCVCVCVAETVSSVYGAPVRFEDGEAVDLKTHIKPQTKIRLIRSGIARCVCQYFSN